MYELGFLDEWIERVMSCVSTSSFSVCINGKAYVNIILTRGLQYVQRGLQPSCPKQKRRGGFMGFQFVGVHQVYPMYYLLMTHYYFVRPIKKKCNASQTHYNCMQHHLASASTLKNILFTLAATQMEHKEKE